MAIILPTIKLISRIPRKFYCFDLRSGHQFFVGKNSYYLPSNRKKKAFGTIRSLSSMIETDSSDISGKNSGNIMQTIVEGTAHMEYDARETVFYNKVQVLNRDISIQVINLFAEKLIAEKKIRHDQIIERRSRGDLKQLQDVSKVLPPITGIKVLDALAASGLRSIRYLKEIPLVQHVTINDLSVDATDLARKNIVLNKIDESRVTVNNQDAVMLMYGCREPPKNYDVIDLDPYGTAAPFLDAAVQAVRGDGGLLCVTCTDMTVLGGSYPETCFAKYQSMPVRGKYLHEMSLRILLHSIDTTANKYKRYIVPWLSLSVDFYVRVFVRVYESPAEVKNSSLRRCMVLQSLQCPSYYLHPVGQSKSKGSNYSAGVVRTPAVCEETGGKLKMGGPIWSAPIHDQEIVDELLTRVMQSISQPDEAHPVPTAKRLAGILTTISEELKDVVLYYSLPELSSAVQIDCPTYEEVQAALNNAGYRVSQFHHEANALKTDAPNEFVSAL